MTTTRPAFAIAPTSARPPTTGRSVPARSASARHAATAASLGIARHQPGYRALREAPVRGGRPGGFHQRLQWQMTTRLPAVTRQRGRLDRRPEAPTTGATCRCRAGPAMSRGAGSAAAPCESAVRRTSPSSVFRPTMGRSRRRRCPGASGSTLSSSQAASGSLFPFACTVPPGDPGRRAPPAPRWPLRPALCRAPRPAPAARRC